MCFHAPRLVDVPFVLTSGHVCIPVLILFSKLDEYVPPHVDKDLIAARLASFMSNNNGTEHQVFPSRVCGRNWLNKPCDSLL